MQRHEFTAQLCPRKGKTTYLAANKDFPSPGFAFGRLFCGLLSDFSSDL